MMRRPTTLLLTAASLATIFPAALGADPKPAATATPKPESKPADSKTPETDEQKTLYALGAAIAKKMQLSIFNLSADDLTWVSAGLGDAVLGDKVSEAYLQEWGQKIEGLARTRMQTSAAKEREVGAKYVAEAAATAGVTKLPSGILMQELKAGTGASPKADDRVKVHYHGTLIDGKVFDSSVQRGEPATFSLQDVIPCWTEGLQQMKVGGKAKLICPADQAWGDMGAPPDIRGGATVLFEVELLGIEAPTPAPAESPATPPAPQTP